MFQAAKETIRWPNHAKCAVLLTIHVDGESLYNRNPQNPSPRRVSYGKYGPTRAVDRLLELTQRKGIPCSYFIPGQIAERYPEMVKKIDACGYEIGFHGFDHEEHMYTDRSTEEWIDVVNRAQDTFQRLIGKRAVGYVATSSDFQMDAPQIWHEQLGFSYSSSMRGDDRPYRTVIDGEETDFIEIPTKWEVDDYVAMAYHMYPAEPAGQDRISSYRLVEDNFMREFKGHYREGLCISYMNHPQVIGSPGKIQILDHLLKYITSKEDVWVATGTEIADWYRKQSEK